MPAELLSLVDAFVASLAGFEPRLHTPDQCVTIVEALARLENATAAARSRAAARAAECGAHRAHGFANAADWLADTTGSSTADAQHELATAQRLDELPATQTLVERGELSMAQAHVIVRTEQERPGTEAEMVDAARTESLRRLRERGRKLRLGALDPAEVERRQHEARSHRWWIDDTGMVRYAGALEPKVGLPLMTRIDVETDRVFREAYRAGRREPRERYASDAFVRSLQGGTKPHATRADVVYVYDVNKDAAHIVGGGPVSTATMRDVAKDAFVKAVLHDGVKVDTVVHYGRKATPAVMRTVLELGDAPAFDGVRCVDCDAPFAIEWDHDDPVANNGPTCVSNFRPRCRRCHDEKTERDRLAGLLRSRAP